MTFTASHSATPPHGRPVPGDHGGVPGGALRPAAGPEGTLPVGTGPWSVRSVGTGAAGRGRAALELYRDGELADVLVAARLTSELLRGAWRGPARGRARARQVFAWGRLAADGTAPSVVFTGRGPLWALRTARRSVTADVAVVAGEFWIAGAEGPFGAVLVEHPAGGAVERMPLRRVREPRGVASHGVEAPAAWVGGAA